MSPRGTDRLTGMGMVTCDISISLDGYAAGPNQTLDQPFGDGVVDGETLHAWMFEHADHHRDEIVAITGAGAYVVGRNMFGPGRGEWDLGWTGWWGDDPPYHAPVFVLTHVPREPLAMAGGTTFHFVTDGPLEALRRAQEVAGERHVAIAGGTSTVNQYLQAGSIDELRLHVVPVVLDVGYVRLFDGVGPIAWSSWASRWTPEVVHLTFRR